jgi:phosphoglycerate dehydrogenase-like enzyme
LPKFLFLPPQDDLTRLFANRMADTFPEVNVVAPKSEEELRKEIVDADAGYGWIPPDILPLANNFKWLANPNSGPFPGYFYDELIQHPLIVTNPRGIYFDHIAHHVMMFVLGLSRGLTYYADAQRARIWDDNARKSKYVDLATSTVLIAGVGGIGSEVARLCQQFGSTVIGIDPRPEHEVPGVEIFEPDAIDRLLPSVDFVVTVTPHTPETEGTWNAGRFGLMKPTAFFINVGRGKTARIDDLADAIESGQIAGCGLDVYETEPLPPDHKLWGLPNVLMTPHIAITDAENIPERRWGIIAENTRRFLSGVPLMNPVDKAAWF